MCPSQVVALTLVLWVATFNMCYALLGTPVTHDDTWLMKLTESFGALERVALWQDATSWLPVVTWPKPAVTWTVRIAMVAMFATYAVAFGAALRTRSARPWQWLAGPVGAQVIMLLMPPSNADVFFYAISGDIANEGLNPYATHLYDVFEHPLYPYNHWVDMTTVYGPVWTLVNQGVMAIAGNDPVRAVLAFKILLGAVAIAVAAGTYGAARLVGAGTGPATAAMVLVGWQPNMIIESGGQAHNDVVMIALALGAVTLTIAGTPSSTRGGLILATLSAAVKYISLPMLALLALTRLDRREPASIAKAWALDAAAVGAVLVAAFSPYWSDWSILREMVIEPGRLYTNPIWHLPASAVQLASQSAGSQFEDATRVIAQIGAIVAIVVVLARFALVVWTSAGPSGQPVGSLPGWTRPLLVSWALVMSILAFVPVNTHSWYWSWPVVPVALVVAQDAGADRTREPPRWLWGYVALTAILTLIYHTRIVNT